MTEYLWIGLIGLVMGALAGQVLRGHFHIVTDMVAGVLGALLGGYLFQTYLSSWGSVTYGPMIFAAIGAGVFLLAWRALGSVE